MKYIILGLGNFGSSLAQKLVGMGHEVIGVDHEMDKVNALKEQITNTICLDITDQQAITNLPLHDADIVMVCIGEDQGANIMATALMKQAGVNRLIARAVSPLHETILEAMHVDEIIHPEEETAERWANKLNIRGVVDSYELTDEYSIVKAKVPEAFVGKTLEELSLRKEYNVLVLTTIKEVEEKNRLGITRKVNQVQGVASSGTRLEEDDIIVLYGEIDHIQKLLKEV